MATRKPWVKTFWKILARTSCPSKVKHKSYKNIKCEITSNELKEIWFRDKAYALKRPSIDRIDPTKNYNYENCRYIELSLNCKLARKRSRENSRFPNEVREEIRNAYSGEWGEQKRLRLLYNISKSYISKILNEAMV